MLAAKNTKLQHTAIFMHIFNNYSLQQLNSFGIPTFTSYYIPLNTLTEIEHICNILDLSKTHFYILGGGTNTLFTGDFPGYVIQVKLTGIEVVNETPHSVLVKAAAGINWHELVLFCVNKGYGGIENLSLIPGSVGAAPLQNIGAYGVELKDTIHTIEAIELSTGKTRIFSLSECEFGYRTSAFKTKFHNQYLITNIVLKLHKEARFVLTYGGILETLETMGVHKPSFKSISDAIMMIRKRKLPHPMHLGNAGSFFKNPLIPITQYQLLQKKYPGLISFTADNEHFIKISAAWLIEAAGFKGFRKGNVGVYESHALILVNYGGATGKEVLNLANLIKQKVANQFDITLTPEVNIMGEYI
ncbi:UDP-N-acetylmuramate dehydrogenase [Cardinium endosymbiont of Tipula unca]|uniref:UDP-N-acetylmuramate dehydrogenase n=1 Tax=Cardinium endosymbiont of Tipula unca TaxID=3066216 RepID=UPI0030CFE3A8